MDKIVDSVLLRAFDICKEINDLPSDYALALHLEINRPSLSRWRSGATKIIRHAQYKVIEPKIRECIAQAEKERLKELENNPGAIHKCTKWSTQVSGDENSEEYKKAKTILDAVAKYNTFSANKDHEIFKLKQEIAELKKVKQEEPVINFPHLPQKVSAGNGVQDDIHLYGKRPDIVILDVDGESMAPDYLDGEQVVAHFYHTPFVFGKDFLPLEFVRILIPENSIIVYERNGDGRAMKQVKYEEGKRTWYLKLTALNTDWAKETRFNRIVRRNEDFKILGIVLGKLNKG
jgi:hypothetical protein